MKEKTSQDLAKPLLIGALMGLISSCPSLVQLLKVGDDKLYVWTSCISSLFYALVFLVLFVLIKKNKVYGDWNVLMAFLWGCVAIMTVTGVLAIYSHDPHDIITSTLITTGTVDLILAVVLVGMCLVMRYRKIDTVAHIVFYLLIIGIIATVAIGTYNLVNVCMNTSEASAIGAAAGGLFNKVLIAIVLFFILRRDEVKGRLFSDRQSVSE